MRTEEEWLDFHQFSSMGQALRQIMNYVDNEAWPTVIEATVEKMIRLDSAIRVRLQEAVKAADAKKGQDD